MSLTRCDNGHLFSSRKYGNICPYCNIAVNTQKKDYNSAEEPDNYHDENTPYIGDLEVMDPVVGWLVCIEGPSKGRDYRIFTEKNYIGRAEDMDIQIIGDNTISRRNHAVLIYDPKKRQTLVLPGESRGLVYLNGEAVYSPQELVSFDTLEMGESKFIFVELCGNNFEWRDLKVSEGSAHTRTTPEE